MGDKTGIAMANKELEELYLGVPDDSVNLTFQDLAEVRQKKTTFASPNMEASPERLNKPMVKLPSLDFTKGLQASFQSSSHGSHSHHQEHRRVEEDSLWGSRGHDGHVDRQHHHYHHHHRHDHGAGFRQDVERRMVSVAYDDVSHVSGMSMAYGLSGRSRRPGIPHSNICTICCNYIYICRHRCLVCGRVYCRQCVGIGMGEMTEGRKCIECLGRRFSQRYIKKAGHVRCCMGYSSAVKQQELKWAERGPRRSGENRYSNHSGMVSRTRSPITPASPSRPCFTSNPPSFVMNSPYSPYSPTNHHPMPF